MDRSLLLPLIVALPAVALINAVIHGLGLQRFLADTAVIESAAQLDRFKQLVKRQMYAALAQIVLLAAPLLLFFYGWGTKVLFNADVLYLLVPALVTLGVGLLFKQVEQKVRALKVHDPDLRAERDRVNEVWLHKPFPDW